ncbi:MAG: Type 1 glutamine amidotransferase-like domain-containing protein [Zavarzinella sp.]
MMHHRILISLVLLSVHLQFSYADDLYPEKIPGTLHLFGANYLTPELRTDFVDTLSEKEPKLVVLLAPENEKVDLDARLAGWKHDKWASTKLVALKSADDAENEENRKAIQAASVLSIETGNLEILRKAFSSNKLRELLQAHVRAGKTILIEGAAAGLVGSLELSQTYPRIQTAPGLGLLEQFCVVPFAFSRDRLDILQQAMRLKPGYVGFGLDTNTYVRVNGRQIIVQGTTGAVVVQNDQQRRVASTQVLGNRQFADIFALRRTAYYRKTGTFPEKSPSPPEVKKGTLVIVGGGGTPPDALKAFVEAAGGVEKQFVVVATAYGDELPKKVFEVGMLRQAGVKNIHVLHTTSRTEANSEEFSKILTKTDGLWFSGGRHWRFIDSYADTLCEKRFREVLDRGGVIGGSSAGASIQADYMPRAHPLGNLEIMAEGYEKGFGYLPGTAIDQHFFARKRPKDMTYLMENHPQYLGIGLDEGTAIIVRGTVCEVVGRSKVAFYDRSSLPPTATPDYLELKSGDRYDLKNRKQLPAK